MTGKNIEQQLSLIIELSNQLTAAVNEVAATNNDDRLPQRLEQLSGDRDQAIHLLFEAYSADLLQQHQTLLQQIVDQDQQLLQLSQQSKSKIAKTLIQKKKHNKATKAYLGG